MEFTLLANKKFETPVIGTHSQREWDFLSVGIDGDQRAQVWQEINESPDFWLRAKTLCTPDELELLDLLTHDRDSAVHFITSRCGNDPEGQSFEWLHRYGICAQALHVVTSPADKPELAKALGVTVAIDDKPETVGGYLEIGIPHVYLMRRLYNQEYEDSAWGFTTVGSILEFIYDDGMRRKKSFEQEAA